MMSNYVKAKKSLGQNFCVDNDIPQEIVNLLNPGKDSIIWEIGPGKGALTSMLIDTGASIRLFEIDERMKEFLIPLVGEENILWGDFLELSSDQLRALPNKNLLVCGNLPYYCGTPIIKRFLEKGPLPKRMVFLLQKEVAEKASAVCGNKDYSYLSVHTAFFAHSFVGNTYGPESFRPRPKIDSTILVVEPLNLKEEEKNSRIKALKYVSFLFNQRRKMALPLLKKQFPNVDWVNEFARYEIDEKARPENIPPDKFLKLFENK